MLLENDEILKHFLYGKLSVAILPHPYRKLIRVFKKQAVSNDNNNLEIPTQSANQNTEVFVSEFVNDVYI